MSMTPEPVPRSISSGITLEVYSQAEISSAQEFMQHMPSIFAAADFIVLKSSLRSQWSRSGAVLQFGILTRISLTGNCKRTIPRSSFICSSVRSRQFTAITGAEYFSCMEAASARLSGESGVWQLSSTTNGLLISFSSETIRSSACWYSSRGISVMLPLDGPRLLLIIG